MSGEGPARPRLPFNVVDEAAHLLDTPGEPWSVQLEARVEGHLDEARLREAVCEAVRRHPMARARKAPAGPFDRRWHWEITGDADVDPLRAVACADDAALDAARAELHSLPVPLVESPPFRVRLARHPGGDVVMVNTNHAAIDGFGGLRLLRSVARAYAGDDDPLPEIDLAEARDLPARLAAPDPPARARRALTLLDKGRDVLAVPARLASEGAEDVPGYAFHHLTLEPSLVEALAGFDHPGTVNDLLLAALHLCIEGWNSDHGGRSGRVSVLMPVNVRPREWWEEMVGNATLMARVATTAGDRRSPASAVEAVTARTKEMKAGGTTAALVELLRRLPSLPVWAKRTVPLLLSATGNRLVDTALLSNLGKIDEPPSFGGDAGATVEMWFSAPARMPLGLSVGVVTAAGRLHIAFRHRHALFDGAAARRFAERYVHTLERLVE